MDSRAMALHRTCETATMHAAATTTTTTMTQNGVFCGVGERRIGLKKLKNPWNSVSKRVGIRCCCNKIDEDECNNSGNNSSGGRGRSEFEFVGIRPFCSSKFGGENNSVELFKTDAAALDRLGLGRRRLLLTSLLLAFPNWLSSVDASHAVVGLNASDEGSDSATTQIVEEMIGGEEQLSSDPNLNAFLYEEEELVASIFEQTAPSVVSIMNIEIVSEARDGKEEDTKLEGTGSGFVWDKYGHIVTNYHVVAKLANDSSGKQRSRVSLLGTDGKTTMHDVQLIGLDSSRDLAVLKILVEPERLRPIPIGTSGDLKVGQFCFAIGNPYGFDHTLTTGVVSGLGREIPSPAGRPISGAIQTDASINSGNSGGPLVDSFGRLIGVNTATFTRQGTGMSSGVNFAVPVDAVRRVVPRLIVYGSLVPVNSNEAPRGAAAPVPATAPN